MMPEQSALLQKAQSSIDAAKLLVSEAFFDKNRANYLHCR